MRIILRSISLTALCALLGACSHLGPTRLAGDPEPPAAEEDVVEKSDRATAVELTKKATTGQEPDSGKPNRSGLLHILGDVFSPRNTDDDAPKDAATVVDESTPAPTKPTKKGFFAKLLSPRKADDVDPKDAATVVDESEPTPAEPAKKGFFAKLFPWSQKTPEPEESQPESEPEPAVETEDPLPSAMDSSEPAPREPETTLAPAHVPSPASGKPGDPLDDVGLYPKDQ